LHGANRLASNSLMEALIFGTRAARDIGAQTFPRRRRVRAPVPRGIESAGDLPLALAPLRAMMSALVGVVRDEAGLSRAVGFCDAFALTPACRDPRVRDAVAVARLVASAALARRESRGTHFRRDFVQTDARLSARSFVAARSAAMAKTS
jgi:L-aspartate oxidase